MMMRPRFLNAAATLAAALVVAATPAVFAQTAPVLPTGPQVVQGNASVVQTGKQLQVTNSPGTVINWQSFGIAPGHNTYFQQQSANSSVLNQVVTNNPSQIFGTLGSNGRVILVNPSGIVVGAGAVVDTAGFVASTLALTESDTALSRLKFAASGQSPGTLQVDGIIRSSQGDIILIAPHAHIGLAGVVKALDGSVILAAGQQVLLTGRGLDGIALQLQAPTDQAINLGRLEGNAVGLFAAQLRNTGVIQANTAELVGGRVVLRAVDSANVSGSIIAAGLGPTSRGGVVTVEARDVQLQAASINASGTGGGGTVLIGGGWQGRDASVANSKNTVVDAASSINVSGMGTASAGTAVVWSDANTFYAGQIQARGGAAGGNGGQVEVSGKENLGFDGRVRVDAPRGVGGSILLDPKNIDISFTGTNVLGSITFGQFGTTTQTIFASSLQNAVNSLFGGTLTLQATNDINVNQALTFSNVGGNVNFEAGRSVNINQPISFGTANTANFTITANSPNATVTLPYRDAGFGGINMTSAASINMGGSGTLALLVGNGGGAGGGGGSVTFSTLSNMQTLVVDNSAVLGASTGGIYANPGSSISVAAGGRVFLRTALGSIGTAAQNIPINASLTSVSAASGNAYLQSANPLFLGPAPELVGAAAIVGGTLSMAGTSNNIGVRGARFGSGAVTAGQLVFSGGPASIYSNSTNASGPLVVTVGGISGLPAVSFDNLAVVTTSLVVGAGGINIGGALSVLGSNISAFAPASVSSVGDVNVTDLYVNGYSSGANVVVNGPSGLLKVASPAITNVQIIGGTNPGAPASVTANAVVVGSPTATVTFILQGGSGPNSFAELISTAGDVNIYGLSSVQIGATTAQTGAFSRIGASAGSVNISSAASGTSINVTAGLGNGSFAEISSLQGVTLKASTIALSGGSGPLSPARISTIGPVTFDASTRTTLTGGTGVQSGAVVTSINATVINGPLSLVGGAGIGSLALVTTSATVTATGPVTFNTSVAGTGSHALISAGTNGVTFALANPGYTRTLAVNASSTAAPVSGVIVPPADVAIFVVLPPSGLPGGTVSATVTFSNPGLITATFTPTLVVDGITTTFAALSLPPNSTITTITTVLLSAGTSTTVAAATGNTNWPELNLANNTASAIITLAAFADLQAFVALPANAIAGTTVIGTVTFTNQGPSTNTFTPTVVVNGVTQTLAPVTLPSGGTYTTTISVPVGISGFIFTASGTSTVVDPVPGNNSATSSGVSLLSDIGTVVTLPSSANANTTVSGVVTFTNFGGATTTFTPFIGQGGVTQTLAQVTLSPNGVYSTTTVVLVGLIGNSLVGGVAANSVPDSNASNNSGSAFVEVLVPPPPPPPLPLPLPPPLPPSPPVVTPTAPVPTPSVVVTTPVVVAPTPTVVLTPPTVGNPTPTVVVTPPTVVTPTPVMLTPPLSTTTAAPPVPITVRPVVPDLLTPVVVPVAALAATTPLQLAGLLQQSQTAFNDTQRILLLLIDPLVVTNPPNYSELPMCPR